MDVNIVDVSPDFLLSVSQAVYDSSTVYLISVVNQGVQFISGCILGAVSGLAMIWGMFFHDV